MVNFIDRPFVLALFDERLLLKKIEPIIEKVAELRRDSIQKLFESYYFNNLNAKAPIVRP